ncbi:MAG: urease accessory protein UreD [Actinomycetota bacterium]|nr:urease accessory protein UreD [Actinomycetota bacterium]
MRARAALVAEVDGRGVTRLTRIRSEPPLVLRATPGGVYLVGGAGGPLGGDDLTVEVEVGPGAVLTVRTAAASVVQPGDAPSRVRVRATVAAGGRLEWLPEPVVVARGSRHHVETELTIEDGATVGWREEIVLGRHGETPGTVVTRTTVDAGGAPLLRHELSLGPQHRHAAGPAVVGAARAVGSVLLVEPAWATGRPPAAPVGVTAAVLPLDGPAVQIVALAVGAIDLRRDLENGERLARAYVARVCPVTPVGTNGT